MTSTAPQESRLLNSWNVKMKQLTSPSSRMMMNFHGQKDNQWVQSEQPGAEQMKISGHLEASDTAPQPCTQNLLLLLFGYWSAISMDLKWASEIGLCHQKGPAEYLFLADNPFLHFSHPGSFHSLVSGLVTPGRTRTADSHDCRELVLTYTPYRTDTTP